MRRYDRSANLHFAQTGKFTGFFMNDLLEIAKQFIRGRRRDYQLALLSQPGERVLEDLAKFCKANESCFHPDERVAALMEGRREVWLRIQHHLNLSDEQLYKLYSRKNAHD